MNNHYRFARATAEAHRRLVWKARCAILIDAFWMMVAIAAGLVMIILLSGCMTRNPGPVPICSTDMGCAEYSLDNNIEECNYATPWYC